MSEPQQGATQQPGATFQIEKIYVKDLSLEIPNAPQIFMQPAQPQLEVQIDTGAQPFAEGYYEATVSATVTAKVGDKTLFLVEAVQAGVFQMRNVPQADLNPLLGIACPTILFPYLREASESAPGRPRATSSANDGPECAPQRGISGSSIWCGSEPVPCSKPLHSQISGAGLCLRRSLRPATGVAARKRSALAGKSALTFTAAGISTFGR